MGLNRENAQTRKAVAKHHSSAQKESIAAKLRASALFNTHLFDTHRCGSGRFNYADPGAEGQEAT